MARINSYPKDINVQDKDAWIGTDLLTRATRQFTAQSIADYLNVKGKVSIAGQISYKFYKTPYELQGTFALQSGLGNGTPFSDITVLAIARTNVTGNNVVNFVEYLVGQNILITQQDDVNAFGHYKIVSYVQDTANPTFYNITLSYIGGNGNLYLDKIYDIVNFEFAKDKHHVHTQGSASATWDIQHNMDKFPSVSVVNNNNLLMYGETTYVDTNNLIINFSAGFSGKAYLN